jgi:integrase
MEALGEDREVASLTRNDARHFRDFLMSKGLAIGSGRKNLKIAAAIIECGLADRQIAMRNPFRGLHMTDEIAAIDARLPLSQEEIAIARSMSVNAELSTIVELLVLTGARLNEIAGLEWNDVDLASDAGISSITIRMNGIRRLKTANSKRKVPLVEEAKDALLKLRTALITQDARGAVFPRYGRPGGSDAASAALMKALRKAGVHDRRKSIHSIRHSVKQALRDAGCPKDISDAIQGHLSNDISNTYGIGHSMVHMLSWISKITTNSKDTS